MKDEIVIRPVKESDVERICGIAVRAWQPIKEGYKKAMGEELFQVVHGDWQNTKLLLEIKMEKASR